MRIQDVFKNYKSMDRLVVAAERFGEAIKLAFENNCKIQTHKELKKLTRLSWDHETKWKTLTKIPCYLQTIEERKRFQKE